ARGPGVCCFWPHVFVRRITAFSLLQLVGAECLVVVVAIHVCEALRLFPWMRLGRSTQHPTRWDRALGPDDARSRPTRHEVGWFDGPRAPISSPQPAEHTNA